jgi:gluconate 2-dehydrogenase gamma chain
MDRRTLIKSFATLAPAAAVAATASGTLERTARTVSATEISAVALPMPVRRGGLEFLTADEAAQVGAIFERLIPTDELGAGARDAGCVEFLDRQLAGAYGKAAAMYRSGPIVPGTPQQGPQFKETPAERYRNGLMALDRYCRQNGGAGFAALDVAKQDALLSQLETGVLALEGVDGVAFFALMLQNVREGYFADPMYGGNKDMVGWRLVGFPGARYDYRDVIGKKGEKLDLEPVSMLDRNA